MTNPSVVEAPFVWSFAADGFDVSPVGGPFRPYTSFDVLPIRGVLPPAASEQVELYYKGATNCKMRALAPCQVSCMVHVQVTSYELQATSYKLQVTNGRVCVFGFQYRYR